jgi:hypothetical protein
MKEKHAPNKASLVIPSKNCENLKFINAVPTWRRQFFFKSTVKLDNSLVLGSEFGSEIYDNL